MTDPDRMTDPVATIVSFLLERDRHPGSATPIDSRRWLAGDGPAALSAAFLVILAQPGEPSVAEAQRVLGAPPPDAPAGLAELYAQGLRAIPVEVAARRAIDPAFAAELDRVAATLTGPGLDERTARETIWSVLYPEAVGLLDDVPGSVAALRRQRLVHVDEPNPDPIQDPGREVLFTSNVLLGLPLDDAPLDRLGLDPEIRTAVTRARSGSQRHWFDHPVPIGIEPSANEVLHGLRGLDAAIQAEAVLAGELEPGRLTCLLSVSVTHDELRDVARRYIEVELGRTEPLDHLDVVVAGETEVRRLVDEVLRPAIARFVPTPADGSGPGSGLDVLGVDGEYGRHYSFLKAIAAIWQVLIDPGVRATFKIDLDQVFPEAELVAETGRSAFQHLQTPLWGARGRDARGAPVELGMIAGTLVNAADIARGLFSPDVALPAGPDQPSEHVFYSVLPQAISTRAEMLERYNTPEPDGTHTALERIHVTGGTNGVLVAALRRHRPFTPSFIGRAEDQAYVLSILGEPGPRLAYVHAAGLVMRHDKDAFAGPAIEAARIGKLVGDDVRILVFSACAAAVATSHPGSGLDVAAIKELLDPFTGGFIARLPTTTVLVRFALRVLEAYGADRAESGRAYATIGSGRLVETLRQTADPAGFRAGVERERSQWSALYDALDGLEAAIAAGDPAAIALRDRARVLVDGWRIAPGQPN